MHPAHGTQAESYIHYKCTVDQYRVGASCLFLTGNILVATAVLFKITPLQASTYLLITQAALTWWYEIATQFLLM